MRKNALRIFFILVFCLSTVHFFEPVFLSDSVKFYAYLGVFAIGMFFILLKSKYKWRNIFLLPISLILVAEVLSGFSATFSWNQGLADSMKALVEYMSYGLFFLLVVWKLEIREVEKIFVILGVIYSIVFLITFAIYPTQIFGNVGKYSDDRGFQRIVVNGIGFLFLLNFYALNKYALKNETFWLFGYLFSMLCIVMTLTRTYIFFSFLFSIIFFFRNSSFIKRVLAIFVFVGCSYMISQTIFFEKLTKMTIAQIEGKNDDIRLKAANYYLYDFSPNTFAKIFGNGEPYWKDNEYRKFIKELQRELGLYSSDVGYIGLYAKFGVLAILAYLIIIFRTLKARQSKEYLYSKYYLVFIFTISLIVDAPFNNGFIPSIVFALYVLSIADSRTKFYMYLLKTKKANTNTSNEKMPISNSDSGL